MSKSPKPADVSQLTYEQALSQLESIVERIESGQIGLEEMLAEYERGVALHRRCKEVLERAELRIEELARAATTPAAGKAGSSSGERAANADDGEPAPF